MSRPQPCRCPSCLLHVLYVRTVQSRVGSTCSRYSVREVSVLSSTSLQHGVKGWQTESMSLEFLVVVPPAQIDQDAGKGLVLRATIINRPTLRLQ